MGSAFFLLAATIQQNGNITVITYNYVSPTLNLSLWRRGRLRSAVRRANSHRGERELWRLQPRQHGHLLFWPKHQSADHECNNTLGSQFGWKCCRAKFLNFGVRAPREVTDGVTEDFKDSRVLRESFNKIAPHMLLKIEYSVCHIQTDITSCQLTIYTEYCMSKLYY